MAYCNFSLAVTRAARDLKNHHLTALICVNVHFFLLQRMSKVLYRPIFYDMMTPPEGISRQSKVSTEEAGAARCVKLLTNIRIFLFNLREDYSSQPSPHVCRLKLKLKMLLRRCVYSQKQNKTKRGFLHGPISQASMGFKNSTTAKDF